MQVFMLNFKRIWLCIYRGEEKPPTHDLKFKLLYE
jgi:hypothetical protein